MKKIGLLILTIIFASQFILALNLDIEKKSLNEVFILGLNKPATFDLQITNLGPSDNLIFYSYFSQSVFPKGTTPIEGLETKNILIEIYPPENLKNFGNSRFDLYIRGQNKDELIYPVTVNAVSLDEVFAVTADDINSESKRMTIYLENKVNFNFEEIHVKFTSPFFEKDEIISIKPYEVKNITITLNKEEFSKLKAGFYTLNAKINVEELSTEIEGKITFRESNILTTTKKTYGVIVNTQLTSRINEGNVMEKTETTLKKNIISRLFTTFNPEPDYAERKGFAVYYTWVKEIQPGERFDIKMKTNWLFPFIVIILLVIVVYLLKEYTRKDVLLRKRVSFVRAKGGEFALKISIIVHARKFVEKVSVIDRLPPLVNLHEKFPPLRPSKIDIPNKKLEWQFEKLEEGETRVLNYIIFSKIGIVGQFALPRTTAIFERDGQIKELQSNRTYFMAEQRGAERDSEEA
jgi:hypothetical protein